MNTAKLLDNRMLYEHKAWVNYTNNMRQKLIDKFHNKNCWNTATETQIFEFLYNEFNKLIIEELNRDNLSSEMKLSILLNIGNYSMMLYDLIKVEMENGK